MKRMQVDVWSDVICSWCAIGKRPADVLLQALEQAWASAEEHDEGAAEGAACSPEGCV